MSGSWPIRYSKSLRTAISTEASPAALATIVGQVEGSTLAELTEVETVEVGAKVLVQTGRGAALVPWETKTSIGS